MECEQDPGTGRKRGLEGGMACHEERLRDRTRETKEFPGRAASSVLAPKTFAYQPRDCSHLSRQPSLGTTRTAPAYGPGWAPEGSWAELGGY